MNPSLTLEPRRGPPTGEEETQRDRYDPKDHLQGSLVIVEFLPKSPKEGAKADEDEGKTNDKRQRANEGSPATRTSFKSARRAT
jgi:hypothetical protein